MNKLRTVIIDDEKLAVTGLTKLVEKHCTQLELVGTATTFVDALKIINEEKPQLVFLDIEMPHANGFTLLDSLTFKDFRFIFTTAYADYAVQAIKAKADDYLLKPIDSDELKSAVDKVYANVIEGAIPSVGANRLIVNTQDSIYYLDYDEISFLKSDGNYSVIHLKGGKTITTSQTIKRMEEKLNPEQFVRVHHSYIVNQKEIFEFNKSNLKILLHDGTMIPVSIRKKKAILS